MMLAREPLDRSGKLQPLKFGIRGHWSRRLDREYQVERELVGVLRLYGLGTNTEALSFQPQKSPALRPGFWT